MEKYMKNICNSTDKHAHKALSITHIFWLIYDSIKNTNHTEIFEYLYMTPNKSETYLKTSMDLFINIRTLERYRKAYVKSFEAVLSILKDINIILDAA